MQKKLKITRLMPSGSFIKYSWKTKYCQCDVPENFFKKKDGSDSPWKKIPTCWTKDTLNSDSDQKKFLKYSRLRICTSLKG